MLEMRKTVAITVHEHRQIVLDVCLCEVVRELVKIQHSLSNLQSVVIDSTIRVLSPAGFLCKKRTDTKSRAIQTRLVMAEVPGRKTKLNAFLKFRNSFNRLFQVCIGHGVLCCKGLMMEGLRGLRHLPAPLSKTKIESEYCIQREVEAAWL